MLLKCTLIFYLMFPVLYIMGILIISLLFPTMMHETNNPRIKTICKAVDMIFKIYVIISFAGFFVMLLIILCI